MRKNIFCTCVFDPKRDNYPVNDTPSIRVSEILYSGVVPPEVSDDSYCSDVNTEDIAGRVGNTFDAIDESRNIVGRVLMTQNTPISALEQNSGN